MRGRRASVGLGALLLGSVMGHAAEDLHGILTFEGTTGGEVHGWRGGPASTLFADDAIVHSGSWAGRIERDAGSPDGFSTFTYSIPMDFDGEVLEFRGYLRTADVAGFAALWLREDSASGSVAFDNMAKRELRGTTDWTEYVITLPLRGEARKVFFGALLSGTGTVWVDDLALLVDGKPVAEAPRIEGEPTALDLDHEFDEGSGIEVGELTPERVARLAALGKVWGFVKYHHPRIAAGEVHWDYELFRVLPRVLEAGSDKAARKAMVDWLGRLGPPEPCAPCATAPENAHLEAELDWIRDRDALGAKLSAWLERVHERRPAGGEHFFVSLEPGVGNPILANEPAYFGQKDPDAGYRILALFRLWNVIRYWFPYRDQLDDDWDKVLREFLPRLAGAADRDSYRLELMALVARVRDGHANLWGEMDVLPPRGDCQLPVGLRFVEGQALAWAHLDDVSGPASGLRVGDVIVALDGATVDAIIEKARPYYAASNEPAQLRGMMRSLTRGAVVVRGRRGNEPFELSASRVPIEKLDLGRGLTHDLPGETFRRLSAEVAYLKLSAVDADSAAGYAEGSAGARGLIVDIRNYPSAFTVFDLGGRLVAEPTPFARFTVPDLTNPGAFLWTPTLELQPLAPRFEGKVVILVDESSLSQAEYTAMALRAAPGAVVVGSTTAGADGNVSTIPLPGGINAMMSGIGVFYPDKSPTQRVGIVPDVVVHPTVEGIRQGRDEVLERALRIVLGDGRDEAEIRRLYRSPEPPSSGR